MTGHITDPEDGKKVAGTIFSAVIVYAVSSLPLISPSEGNASAAMTWHGSLLAGDFERGLKLRSQVFLVFCSCQAFLHVRERRRGAISLS